MNVGGTEVLVEGPPDGRVVLMLHGWPDTHVLWDAQVAALRSRFRCARFTLPGFELGSSRGAVTFEEMLTLLDEIVDAVSPTEPVVLLLHDWGCFFGYQYAMLRPDRVDRVIGIDIGDAGSPAHIASLSVAAKAMTASYQLWLAAAWRLGGRAGSAMTRALARAVKAPTPAEHIHVGMNHPYDLLWRGAYREALPLELACPLLFLYGRRKPFMFHSPQWAGALATHPGCAVIGFNDAGHWVMVDAAAAVNEAVLDWLDRADALTAA